MLGVALREYELVMVLVPTLSQDEVVSINERVKGLITDRGGDVAYEDIWGMRRLAYPVRKAGSKFLEGNYVLSRFNLDGQYTKDLEGFLKLSDNILRYLLVKAEGPVPSPRVVESPQSVVNDNNDAGRGAEATVDVQEESAVAGEAVTEGEQDVGSVVEDQTGMEGDLAPSDSSETSVQTETVTPDDGESPVLLEETEKPTDPPNDDSSDGPQNSNEDGERPATETLQG